MCVCLIRGARFGATIKCTERYFPFEERSDETVAYRLSTLAIRPKKFTRARYCCAVLDSCTEREYAIGKRFYLYVLRTHNDIIAPYRRIWFIIIFFFSIPRRMRRKKKIRLPENLLLRDSLVARIAAALFIYVH